MRQSIAVEELKLYCSLCADVLAIDCKPSSLADYAKGYANATLPNLHPETVERQIHYILHNLKAWRGEQAQITKSGFIALIRSITE